MTFNQAAKPFINDKLEKASDALTQKRRQLSFQLLEDAHVIGQQSTYCHCLVHLKMLQFGLKTRNTKEVIGQCFRLVGAATKTIFGGVPKGNTGGVNVSPFTPMSISVGNQAIIDEIKVKMKHAQS
ncbi:hypothetical protein GPUN_1675 [Glaciecola punicea ACAM 611]|uniref:DUF3703 domain-containing protein n=1 Tax=Glaciecola punicea ACAM 611 TaxID=1121923 RepID=H5TBW4_9ALTE|nr:DUF3703 domain-containing protein [Glaciecola punicea]GAB55791.1 hypothetical protein GPUN_1675 [Glaciecola punicea ACAM 611]